MVEDAYPRAKAAADVVRQELHNTAHVHAVGVGPNVVGGERTGEIAVVVFVRTKVGAQNLARSDLVPDIVTLEDGTEIPTDVQQSDQFREDSASASAPRRTLHRPLVGGISIGVTDSGTSGTLGAVFVDDQSRTVALSNRHVMSDPNTSGTGDTIVQPSRAYSDINNEIGSVVEQSSWDTDATQDSGTPNTTDTALCELNSSTTPTGQALSLGNNDLGAPESPLLDVTYILEGVTSRIGSSDVVASDVSATVEYNDGTQLYYEGLVAFEPLSMDGDSGGLWARYDADADVAYPAAVNFASSNQRSLAVPWGAIETAHGTLTPVSTASGNEPQPTVTQTMTHAAPHSLRTNNRGQLEVLVTPYGDPDAMDDHTIAVRDGGASGPVIDSVTLSSPAWGQSQVIGFDVYDALGEGAHEITLDPEHWYVDAYQIEVTSDRAEFPIRPTITDTTGTPIQNANVSVRERDSTTQVGSDTTNADGVAEIWVEGGEFTIAIEDDRYRTDMRDISVSGTYDPTIQLDEYGNATGSDVSDLNIVNTLTTTTGGEATVQALEHGEYIISAEKAGYRTLYQRVMHDQTQTVQLRLEPTDLVSPPTEPGGDDEEPDEPGTIPANDRLNLPQAGSFFELVPLTARTDESLRLPVLVANAGGSGDVSEIRLEDPVGRISDRQTVTLGAGSFTIVRLSARLLLERSAATPASGRISSADSSESVSVFRGGTQAELNGPGRPIQLGGQSAGRYGTLGGRLPATLGRWYDHEPLAQEPVARVANDWAITLINPAGERRHERAATSPDPELVHTEMMDWQLDVPADPSLEEWTFATEAVVTFDEEIIFRGWCHEASTSTSDQVTTLAGVGPAGELAQGSLDMTFSRIYAWRAIEQVLDASAPEWDWTVVPPARANQSLIENEDVSGSPLECIEQLHTNYGYHFRISNTQRRQAVSFPAGGHAVASSEGLTSDIITSAERTQTSENYANAVEVVGAENEESGDHHRGEYVDDAEVERLASELNIRESDAREMVQLRDPSVESDQQARVQAQAKTREFVRRNELGGTIETPAQLFSPGFAYSLPWDDEVATGAFSLQFTPTNGSMVEVPPALFRERPGRGAIAMWVNAPWSQLADSEARLFGAETEEGRGIRTRDADALTGIFDTVQDSQARVSAYPGDMSPPDNEWVFVWYDWNLLNTRTTFRAGVGGEVRDEAVVEQDVPETRTNTAWFGHWQGDFYLGQMDHLRMFEEPQPLSYYQRLANGEHVPATELASSYPMNEGPERYPETVHDVVGGHHGDASGVVTAGSPQTLERVSISGGTASLEFQRIVTEKDAISHALREIRRMQ